MKTSVFVAILLSFGYFHCDDAAAAAVGPPSNVPVGNAVQNPWMVLVRRNPMLQVDPDNIVDVFSHYGNRKFLYQTATEQQEVVNALRETAQLYEPEVGPIWNHGHAIEKAAEHIKANPGRIWDGGWYTTQWGKMSVLHISVPIVN